MGNRLFASAITVLVGSACTQDPDKLLQYVDPTTGDLEVDNDGDGFTGDADCDDFNAAINVGAEEVCDGIDNDCDGTVDEGAPSATIWALDADGDGYGDPTATVQACIAPTEHYVDNAADCDDTDANIHPFATEICNGEDDDCDGDVDGDDPDSDIDPGDVWYIDGDNDGFGDFVTAVEDCAPDDGNTWVNNGDDCDDTDDGIHPDASEICDEIDNDCDGYIDDEDTLDLSDPDHGTSAYFGDDDGDGYGEVAISVDACEQPDGYTATPGDCDDTDENTYPGAPEVCDGEVNDCDDLSSTPDAGLTTWLSFADIDGDSYGDPETSVLDCTTPSGYVPDPTDCNDGDPGENLTNMGASYYDTDDNGISDCYSDVYYLWQTGDGESVWEIDTGDVDGDGDSTELLAEDMGNYSLSWPAGCSSSSGTWGFNANGDLYGSSSNACTAISISTGSYVGHVTVSFDFDNEDPTSWFGSYAYATNGDIIFAMMEYTSYSGSHSALALYSCDTATFACTELAKTQDAALFNETGTLTFGTDTVSGTGILYADAAGVRVEYSASAIELTPGAVGIVTADTDTALVVSEFTVAGDGYAYNSVTGRWE